LHHYKIPGLYCWNFYRLWNTSPWKGFQVVMGLGQKILIWVGSGQPFMAWVWFWKISPKNVKFFNFFTFGSKKIFSGHFKKYLGQRRVSLLFTVGQKQAWVGSGQGPSLVSWFPNPLGIRGVKIHNFRLLQSCWFSG